MDISPHNSAHYGNTGELFAAVSQNDDGMIFEKVTSFNVTKLASLKDLVQLTWSNQKGFLEIAHSGENKTLSDLIKSGKKITIRNQDGTQTTLNTNQVSLRVLSAAETTNMLQRMFQGIRKEKEDRENGVPTHTNRPEITSGDVKDAAQGVKGEQKKAPPAFVESMVRGILRQIRETDKVRKEKEAERIEEEKDLKQSVIKRQEQNREVLNNEIAMQEGLPPNPKKAKRDA